MKKISFQQILPHIIAIGIFLAVSIIYCYPALQGKILEQHDIIHWKGMAQSSFEYKETYGEFPKWNTNLFGGMPAYQIAMSANSYMPNVHKILTLGLPVPIAFFFLACVCFYILTCVLKCKPVVGILTSLAFAFASYDPIIISVGHETKMWAIAYMPGVLAGLLLIYKKEYLLGFALTSVFATWEVMFNHPQITYYLFISILVISIGFLIRWIKEKHWKHIGIVAVLSAIAGFISVSNSAMTLLTTAEYANYTMRGGKSIDVNAQGEVAAANTKGLDADYAFSYSIGRTEVLTGLMPDVYGSGSSERFDENSKLVSALEEKNVPRDQAIQLAQSLPRYWGGITEGTAGTIYFGAIICLLAIIGFVVVQNQLKWWVLAAMVVAIFMAWGRNFEGFNTFLLNNLPLYNKFRSPNTALVIPQLLLPVLAALALQQVFFTDNGKAILQASFKKVLYVVGGLLGVIFVIYLFNDFSSSFDSRIFQAYTNPENGSTEVGSMIVNAMKADRKAMFLGSIGRTVLFVALLLGLLYAYLKNSLQALTVVVILGVVNTVDLLVIAKKYLNADHFVAADTYQGNFTPSAANATILQDKDPHYRVYALTPDRFSDAITSYFHRSIGGYHPAKLRLYQDLIETQLSKSPMNMDVLNMLDTRYFITPPQQGQPQYAAHRNEDALGPVWFVKNVQYVSGSVEEIKALDAFGPKENVIVDESFRNTIGNSPVFDSAAQITLTSYNNDEIKYSSNAGSDQIAVFSEIYYPAGWNAYIDGQKTDYAKVNYLLRGMKVPAGQHEIVFKFEPQSYATGQNLMYAGNGLLWLALMGGLWSVWSRIKRD